ncbi:MAG: peptide-methionine (S)-S-oxide reductase MsrA [Thaumarchaeota archaeon]|nr:peptide-methionine (S)-S-oxide reductase MsrA [Nitrososphaerota archaeon]
MGWSVSRLGVFARPGLHIPPTEDHAERVSELTYGPNGTEPEEGPVSFNPSGRSRGSSTELNKATMGSGCFWCSEAVFSELMGVAKVEPGYSGGSVPNPTYEQVCTDETGHAEVAQITFDPATISYRELLEVFFSTHDPTTPNRQGADVGSQYRSVIFYHDEEQKKEAESMVRELTSEKVFRNPIVTQVVPLVGFYPAEDYHRDYYRRNSSQPYCQAVIAPKLTKFRAHFQTKLKRAEQTARG